MIEGMIDTDHHGENGLPLHNGGKKDYVWSAEDPFGCLLILPCSVIKINEKLQLIGVFALLDPKLLYQQDLGL